jgi:hypothetical protein
MLKSLFAMLLAVLTAAGALHAQGTYVIKSRLNTKPAISLQEQTSCALPDGTRRPLTTEIVHEGETYRCVEVFMPTPALLVAPGQSQTLTVNSAGWIKVGVR